MLYPGAVAPNRMGSAVGKVARATIGFGVLTPFTVDVVSLPAGAIIKRAWVEVVEAFDAGTTNVLDLGWATALGAVVPSASITEGAPGIYPAAGVGPLAALSAARVVQLTYTQTGTAATTGAATAYVEYLLPS